MMHFDELNLCMQIKMADFLLLHFLAIHFICLYCTKQFFNTELLFFFIWAKYQFNIMYVDYYFQMFYKLPTNNLFVLFIIFVSMYRKTGRFHEQAATNPIWIVNSNVQPMYRNVNNHVKETGDNKRRLNKSL